ncbi:MAG TPA: CHASE4 domain-containing protein, partial [Methanospirillum sp.]|nr:CHASE4 domain-containing protein [Methanospirillum sp.]
MDLRAKTFLIIGLTLLGGIALIILFSFTLLTESYSRFEEDNARQNVINGLKVLSNEKDQIYSLTGDWSRWDETYLFVQDKNENYIIKNLNYASIYNLGIDILIFFRKDNSLKYATQINTTAGHMESVSDLVVSQVSAIPGFFTFESILDGKSGYILLQDDPAIITSQPI